MTHDAPDSSGKPTTDTPLPDGGLFSIELQRRLDAAKSADKAILHKVAEKGDLRDSALEQCIEENTFFPDERLAKMCQVIDPSWQLRPIDPAKNEVSDGVQRYEIYWRKKRLGDWLREQRSERDIPEKKLESKLRYKSRGFYNRCRFNTFTQQELEVILQVLGIIKSVEQFEGELAKCCEDHEYFRAVDDATPVPTTPWDMLDQTFDAIDDRLKDITVRLKPLLDEYVRILDQLGEGDFIAIITSTEELNLIDTASTMIGKQLFTHTAEAIMRGAIVLWLCPSARFVRSYADKYHFNNLRTADDFESDYTEFVSKVKEYRLQISSNRTEEEVDACCGFVHYDECPVIIPNTVITLLGMLRPNDQNQPEIRKRAIFRMPDDLLGSLLIYRQSQAFEMRLLEFVKFELDRHSEKAKAKSAIKPLHDLLHNRREQTRILAKRQQRAS